MSDLVQRLRAPRPRPGYDKPLPPHPWMVEAADRIAALEAALREACELFNRDLAAYKSEAPLVTAEIEAFLDRYESESETVAEPEHHHQWVEACAGTSVAYFTCATCGAFFDGSPKKTDVKP
jgi:hypothetical protein